MRGHSKKQSFDQKERLISGPQSIFFSVFLKKSENFSAGPTIKDLKKPIQLPSRFGLWNSSIWKIQAQFGPTVASCFSFMRWILILNIFNVFLTSFVINLPQSMYISQNPDTEVEIQCQNVSTDAGGVTWYLMDNVSDCCSQEYQRSIPREAIDFTDLESVKHFFSMVTQGTGWMANTALFYGYYSGTFVFEFNGVSFDFPLAFFTVMLAIFVVNCLAVTFAAAKAFKVDNDVSYDEMHDVQTMDLVYSCWDHRTITDKTADYFKSEIRNHLGVYMNKCVQKQERESRTKFQRCLLITVRVLVNIIVLALLALAFAAIFYVSGKIVPSQLEQHNCSMSIGTLENQDKLNELICTGLKTFLQLKNVVTI